MPCDTHSVSLSDALTVTFVPVRERHGPLARRRGAIRRPRSACRLGRGAMRTTSTTSAAGGTGPLASRAAACFGAGVRQPTAADHGSEVLLLLPDPMRETYSDLLRH